MWLLGDLFFRSATVGPVLERLKGKKHLILGNHDDSWIGKVDRDRYFLSVDSFYSETVNADYWPLIAKRIHMLNAGVEVNDYAPVTFEELVENNAKFREVARGVNG